MRTIVCDICGAKVSDQYSTCTKCGSIINKKRRRLVETDVPPKTNRTRRETPLSEHMTRSETRRGALIGGFVGFSYGGVITFAYFGDALIILPAATILGSVLGVFFVTFREKMLGKTTIRKAVYFSLLLYLSQIVAAFTVLGVQFLIVALIGSVSCGLVFGSLLDQKLNLTSTERQHASKLDS